MCPSRPFLNQELTMKPTTTVADFIRRGREAGHDALGIAHDPEAIMAMAAVHRETFLRDRSERSLRRWRELVADVAAAHSRLPHSMTRRCSRRRRAGASCSPPQSGTRS
jgi:hypothetical protein